MKKILSLILLISLSLSSTIALVTGESEELLRNRAYRLAKSYYNLGNYQRSIRLLRKVIKETKANQAAKQLLVDAYDDVIAQIHIEYIELYIPDVIESATKEVEKSVVDIFNKTGPTPLYWLYSKFYYFRGLIYTLFKNRARANENFIDSLAYDPTNYKSLLWLAQNIVDEFPSYSSEIIKYVETFAGVMPKIKRDKTYLRLKMRVKYSF